MGPLAIARAALLLLGAVAGVLLVNALHGGLASEDKPLGVDHAVFGLLLALAVMPGAVLAWFVRDSSNERIRGLCFGGCIVTGFVALLGGAFLWHSLLDKGEGGLPAWLALGWCMVALPVSAIDAVRARYGRVDETKEPEAPSVTDAEDGS
jgi:hypothetical protein